MKNRKDNVYAKSKLRKVVKEFLAKPSVDGLKKVYSSLDKMQKENIYHRNKVSRLKSGYAQKVKKVTSTKAAKTVKPKTKKPTAKKMS